MADHPVWLSQGVPQGETQPLVVFHYPLAFTLVGREAGAPLTVTVETPLDDIRAEDLAYMENCLLYTSPSPRDGLLSRMPSSA